MLKKRTKKLGEILLQNNVITSQQLHQALEEQKITKKELGQILIKLGFITEKDLAVALSEQLEIPFLELDDYELDEEVLHLIRGDIAHHSLVLPIFAIDNVLTVAMANPQDVTVVDTIRRLTGKQIEPVLATERDLQIAVDQYYGTSVQISDSMDEVIQTLEAESAELEEDVRPEEDLRQLAEDQPVVKLVNMILGQAIRDKASDIHVEPDEDCVRIRFRIDGILHEIFSPPKNLQPAIISRIKILAEMDIAETRVPQDGRFRVRIDNREIDLRVSSMPTAYGENIVMRLLDKSSVLLDIKDLGFSEDNQSKIEDMLSHSYGIILVTGPTGSGKTTTLYSALSYLNSIQKNIITVEDPIEYRLKLIRQSQVNTKTGMTFASGLRAILRQDPDIIMVGEIAGCVNRAFGSVYPTHKRCRWRPFPNGRNGH
jgi:type IV pilus assembly protein PilB